MCGLKLDQSHSDQAMCSVDFAAERTSWTWEDNFGTYRRQASGLRRFRDQREVNIVVPYRDLKANRADDFRSHLLVMTDRLLP